MSDLSPSTAVADGVPAAVAVEGGELNGAPSDEKHAPTGLVNDGECSIALASFLILGSHPGVL